MGSIRLKTKTEEEKVRRCTPEPPTATWASKSTTSGNNKNIVYIVYVQRTYNNVIERQTVPALNI